MGLFGLNVPVEHGGIGGGPVETLIVMEQLGRGLVLEPYLATGVVAPRLIARFGSAAQRSRWLPGIADGSQRFALAALEPQARYDLDDIRTRAERRDGGFVLDGAKSVVPHGDSAHWLIVPARSAEGITLFIVEAAAAGVHAQGFPTIDHQRVAEVRLDHVQVADDQVIGAVGAGFPLLEWAVDQALAALAAEAVGAMDRLTELTCEYLRTRTQFGKPIGSFQALQHRAADMRIAVEQARALALMAAAGADADDRAQRRRGAIAAKAMAGALGPLRRPAGDAAARRHGHDRRDGLRPLLQAPDGDRHDARQHRAPGRGLRRIPLKGSTMSERHPEGQVVVEKRGAVLLIGLDRVEKRNGVTPKMFRELGEAYTLLESSPDLFVGLLHAKGEHFSAGIDLPLMAEYRKEGKPYVPLHLVDPVQMREP